MDFGQLQSVSRAPSSPRRSCLLVVGVQTQKLGIDVNGLFRRADVGREGHFSESSSLTMRRGED
jgi:hypothetical protein